MKEFDLTEEQVKEIRVLNSTLTALKAMLSDELKAEAMSMVIDKVAKTQIEYDEWFSKIESELNIKTTPQNSWSVDFSESKIILV